MASVQFDPIRSVAFGSITASYTPLGAVLANNWRAFKCTNNTDGDMMLSLNGTSDNIFVPAGGFVLYDVAANSPTTKTIDKLVFALGTQFSIKYISAPTKGSVYLEGFYAAGE